MDLLNLGKDSINYIALGLLGGIFANLKSAIDFLKQPSVTWPRGKATTQLRLWLAILTEVLYRPLTGMVMAYAVGIHPFISFAVGFIAPALLNLITIEGPKLFKKYYENKLLGGAGAAAKATGEPETIKVVSAAALDQKVLKTLEDKAETTTKEKEKEL